MPGTKTHHALSQQVADERNRVFEAILKARPLWDREKFAAYTEETNYDSLWDAARAIRTLAELDKLFAFAEPRATTIPAVSQVLAKLLSTEQVAGLLNALLSCDAEPTLSDAEADLGGKIFDQLCLLRPEAVAVAQEAK